MPETDSSEQNKLRRFRFSETAFFKEQDLDFINTLNKYGFSRVAVLDGAECKLPFHRVILCFAGYEASHTDDDDSEAVIHPYYLISQASYRNALSFVRDMRIQGHSFDMNDNIPIKWILDQLPFLMTGKNTLAYIENLGSRFHVQILTTGIDIQITDHIKRKSSDNTCLHCNKCVDNCPTGAITSAGFIRDNCLRNWMLSGRIPPYDISVRMGNRLIGCDECQECCPMNRKGSASIVSFKLKELLSDRENKQLSEMIGNNLAIKNRVIIQACLIAESCKRKDLMPDLEQLLTHPSATVRQAAENALNILKTSV